MSSELGAWLRRQREDRGWTRSEMARQLIRTAKARGDTSLPAVDNISHNIYRWERGVVGPAERYRHYYCGAFGIPFSQFGSSGPSATPGAADPEPGMAEAGVAVPGPAAAAGYRATPPGAGAAVIRREVLMAAHEGSEHAEHAEQRGIGEATLEQFRADTRRLAVQYLTGEPYAMFTEMRRVRNRVAEALDRRQWPRDAAELYLLAGCLNALMAAAATNLGHPDAAEELARSGWAYATIIDHHPLRGWLRLCGAYAAYWGGRPQQALDLTRSGLEFLTEGENAAQLHLHAGVALARLGDPEAARREIAVAREVRDSGYRDELLAIGGEFGFSEATQAYYAGFALAEAGRGEAVAELERATRLYREGPAPGEHHSRRCQMLAHTDLAIARLRSGALDAAAADLEPVLALTPGERTALQLQRLSVLRAELAGTIFQGSPLAQELVDRIEDFTRHAIITESDE